MTRRDYRLLARAFLAAHCALRIEQPCASFIGWRESVERVADALAIDNANFDRVRFLNACGVQS